MARIHIYIADELRDLMGDRDDLNWSRIAQDAFREAMGLPRESLDSRVRRVEEFLADLVGENKPWPKN